MAAISELIRTEGNGTLSFGDYTLGAKAKLDNYEFQITLELAEETEYEIDIDGKSAGTMKTNLGGKLSLSVELEGADAVAIRVEKR